MARLVGINHVALEVGGIEEALAFYGRLFEFSLRGRSAKIAFINMGDQFINLSEGRTQPPDEDRHFGPVVDDKEKVRQRLKEAGVKTCPDEGSSSEIRGEIVLEGMGCADLHKSPTAIEELSRQGIALKEA